MGRGQSGMWNTASCQCGWCEACEAAVDPRYTQESSSSEYVRSNEQLAKGKKRNARLDEGVSFVEKI